MHDHTPDPWPCKRCGDIIDRTSGTGQAKSWCRDCSREYMRQYMADHPEKYYKACPKCDGQCAINAETCRQCRRKPAFTVTCAQCRAPFETNRVNARCCSAQCKKAYSSRDQYRHKVDPLNGTAAECVWCFVAFDFSSHRPCCSAVCSSERDRHWLTWKQPLSCHLPQCVDCSTVIALTANGKRCSDCQVRFDGTRRNHSHARRKRAERNGDSDIHWRLLGDRDTWRCHLCGERVPKVAGTARNDRGATVDHLLPIAAGGTHTWDNVALAHRKCNLSRGDRGIVQLRLVG